MSVRRTFTAVPGDIRDWTRFLQGLFIAREFTMTLGGCTPVPSGTARYTVSAGIVCLSIPDLSGTSDSTLAFLESLPSDITPAHDQSCMARIIDNGVTAVGLVNVGTDTGITLYADMDGGAFTNVGTKGVKFTNIVYPLD